VDLGRLARLKAHVLQGKEFHTRNGVVEVALIAAIALVTAVSY
jgi:hypothetical protein